MIVELAYQPWLIFSTIILGFLTAIYYYLTWNFGYWEKQGVKSDKPWPIFGTLTNPFVKPIDMQDLPRYKKYGRIFGVYDGRYPSLVVGAPELVKIILVKDFNVFRNRAVFPVGRRDNMIKKSVALLKDDEWKTVRNVVTTSFTTGKLKQTFSLMNESAENIVNHLNKFAESREPFDMINFMIAYTMDVIATCGFGIKLSSLNSPDCEFVKNAKRTLKGRPKTTYISMLFPSLVDIFPTFVSRDAIKYFTKLLEEVISTRQKESKKRQDILQILLDATQGTSYPEIFKQMKPMDAEYVIPQAIIFLLGGFDTTANTLCFILYHLIDNPHIQQKLIQDIDNVLSKHNDVISYNSVGEMEYLEMVISETLRINPPTSRIQRFCEEDDYNLNGITLKKGMVVGIPISCMHMDEEFFPNPSIFDPERFSPENRNNINPYAYLPFGYGLRNCVGMRLAMLEMKTVLVHILRNFRISKCSQTQIPFERKYDSLVIAIKSLILTLEKRTDCKPL